MKITREEKRKFVELNYMSELESLNYLATLSYFKEKYGFTDTHLQSLIYLNLLVIDLEQDNLFEEYDKAKEQFYTKHDIYEWFEEYDNYMEIIKEKEQKTIKHFKVLQVVDYDGYEYESYLIKAKDLEVVEKEVERLSNIFFENDYGQHCSLFEFLEEKLLHNFDVIKVEAIFID